MRPNYKNNWINIPEYIRLQRAIEKLQKTESGFARFDVAKGWGKGIRISGDLWDLYLSLDTNVEQNKTSGKVGQPAPSKWLKQARKIEKFLGLVSVLIEK